jgi:hypothetical protein
MHYIIMFHKLFEQIYILKYNYLDKYLETHEFV